MDEIQIRHISDKDKIISLYNILLGFMARIYVSTGGKYPAMEWLSPEEKPKIGDENFLKDFEEKYGPFLKWRLSAELDEVFLATQDNKLVGIIALNHRVVGKDIPWIPKNYARDDVGFIELFAVDPEYRGRGIGKKLFQEAINRLKELGKKPCVVTFPNLEAVKFYESMGGKKEKEYDVFVLYCF